MKIAKKRAASTGKYDTAAAPSTADRFAASVKRAKLREIAWRYAWDDREKQERRRLNVRFKVRLRNMEKLFAYRWGRHLPDDDAGRDDLLVMAHHLHQVAGTLDAHLAAWARLWAPWLADDELTAIIDRVNAKPLRWTADTLAWRLGLNSETRAFLQITTIGATDRNKEQRQKRRQAIKNAGRTQLRRAAGSVSRDEYAAIARAKPWEAFGISRRTWYSRGKPQPVENAAEPAVALVRGQQSNRPMLPANRCKSKKGRSAEGVTATRFAPNWTGPSAAETAPPPSARLRRAGQKPGRN